MKFVWLLVRLGIILSIHQAVLGDHVEGTTNSGRGQMRGVSQSKRQSVVVVDHDDENDRSYVGPQTHRFTKKGANRNPTTTTTPQVPIDPCRDLNTFLTDYMSFSEQCTTAKIEMDGGREALIALEKAYCQLLVIPPTDPSDGSWGQSMFVNMSGFCTPLLNQATLADNTFVAIGDRQKSITAAYNRLTTLYNQAAALIAQCMPTGFVTGAMTLPPGSCNHTEIAPAFNTTCPTIKV